MKRAKESYRVPSASQALDVLEAFTRTGGVLGVTVLSERLGQLRGKGDRRPGQGSFD